MKSGGCSNAEFLQLILQQHDFTKTRHQVGDYAGGHVITCLVLQTYPVETWLYAVDMTRCSITA